ncbi:MAG: winged helix-turn-helix domain-containing protein [Maritimibacter sp.]|nr:winged helix-turn-helix domain-containing protein [Maritimibacter sp.]
MANSHAAVQIGAVIFDPAAGELRAADGQAQMLRPQTAKVLAHLAAHAGEVVTKDALMEAVWQGTHVTDDSLVQCISEIRKALGPVEGKRLKTIPKTGYRLDGSSADSAATARPVRKRRALFAALLVVAGLVAIAAGTWASRPAAPESPIRVAVLPFRNMSPDPDQSYLSNGVAEDLIVSLSQLSDLQVVSRGTSFAVETEGRDMREVAKTLRADVLLDGSVRRLDDALRVSASLVDGKTGANLWAERYEGSAEDMFRFQDEVLGELVRVLSVRLSRAERERLGIRGTTSIAAHDAYLRGRELENLYTNETNLAAEAALSEALRHDPGFALAHAHLSQVYSFRVENRWTRTEAADIAAAFREAEAAVALDPGLPFAHFALGRLYTRSFGADAEKAIAHYEAALALDPNYDDAYMFLANVFIFNGEAERAVPMIAQGFERNPIPPYWYHLAEGMAQYFLGDYPAAEAALVRARDQNPTAPFPYRFLIATYGRLGDLDQAEWTAMEYEALGRSATVKDLLDTASIQDPSYRAAFAEGFRAAGLPED